MFTILFYSCTLQTTLPAQLQVCFLLFLLFFYSGVLPSYSMDVLSLRLVGAVGATRILSGLKLRIFQSEAKGSSRWSLSWYEVSITENRVSRPGDWVSYLNSVCSSVSFSKQDPVGLPPTEINTGTKAGDVGQLECLYNYTDRSLVKHWNGTSQVWRVGNSLGLTNIIRWIWYQYIHSRCVYV